MLLYIGAQKGIVKHSEKSLKQSLKFLPWNPALPGLSPEKWPVEGQTLAVVVVVVVMVVVVVVVVVVLVVVVQCKLYKVLG